MKILSSVLFASLSILLLCAATQTPQRIVIIGDSTVCNYASSAYPWAGWGQEIALYFNAGSVAVTNKAIGGRSSRSFYTDGHWASTLSILQSGDILMIQFGHNDRSTDTSRYTDTADYKMYLGKYITEARALGVHPILVTPMNMDTWTGTTVREVFCEGASNYRAAMIHVGDSLKVPVLDLEQKSKLLMDTLGQTYMTQFHFMNLDTGEYPNYPTGNVDGTHFQEVGSLENARMIVEEIARQSTDSILKILAPNIAPLYSVTITTNNAKGGLITRTRRFPVGATVTMKVKPAAASNVFAYWADSTGKSVTTAKRYTYTQVAHASTWQAVWSGTAPLSSSSKASSSSVSASSSSMIAPVITSLSSASVMEGTAYTISILTVTATDASAGVTLSYSLGGADSAQFLFSTSSHNLYFAKTPSTAIPRDANGDNVYNLIVRVSNGTQTTTQNLSITVTAVALSSSSMIVSSTSQAASSSSTTTTSVRLLQGGTIAVQGHVQIFDLQGHKVREAFVDDVDCQQLPRGLYIVRNIP